MPVARSLTDGSSRSDLTALPHVGPVLAAKLERLGVHRQEDLLFLLPLRYEDRTALAKLGELKPGMRCLTSGEVLLAEIVYRGRRSLLVRVGDGTGQLTLRFFHFSSGQKAAFRHGALVSCYGDVRTGPIGLEMVHPEYRVLPPGKSPAISEALTPVYPLTEGVQQARLRSLVATALERMKSSPPRELLPAAIRAKHGMPTLVEALEYLHRPPADADLAAIEEGRHPCRARLALEELSAHYLSLRNLRALANRERATPLTGGAVAVAPFIAALPFDLTGAQRRVAAEIETDLGRSHPMMRLVQGDVGSGKTVIAAIACLTAMAAGRQAAVMAPTELLAEQHLQNFSEWFRDLPFEIAWLAGSLRPAGRKSALAAIADGRAQLVIGTHALFQEHVAFGRLALVVIDEQHRFGVHQRLALRDKGAADERLPHHLVMTATPIPRTLAMAAYADLDVSVIDELPPGRQPVRTVAMPESRREEVIARVRSACEAGQQAYWVCPLIEESETLDSQAAEKSFEMLRNALPGLEVGLVHGRMSARDKDHVMRAFKSGEIAVLVATTVIEVGVDVPNARLMIIESAERMGLSQLHQLRGRVGRGAAKSHCVLLYRQPLGRMAKSRLAVLRETNDGFVVAERDLELRGPGELLGTRQTGLPQYRVADLVRDAHLMPAVRAAAETLRRECPADADAIVRRWVGESARFGKV
ncbi:MAG TPA: ATP-dependent DNA helicase RecG [Woeseiaceae bacterium]|nr:ATP-dependent DNA helicase RecG [Woeseiaceae bacterium]